MKKLYSILILIALFMIGNVEARPSLRISTRISNGVATVTAIDSSGENTSFKDTKPNWTLSSDGKTYTKTFTTAQNYKTIFEFVDGTTFTADIKFSMSASTVTQPELSLTTITNSDGSVTVVAKDVSGKNLTFKDTKPSWTLSDDELTYTKTFTESQNYTAVFEFTNGKTAKGLISFTVTRPKPVIKVTTKTNSNGSVTVTVRDSSSSAYAFKNTKPTWILSFGDKVYTKTYTTNQDFTSVFEFVDGSVFKVPIKVKIPFVLDTSYEGVNGSTKVTVTSNIKFQDTKPSWTLSSDGYTYTKTFTESQNYSTSFQSIYGDVAKVDLNVNVIYEKPTLTVSYVPNDDNTVTAVVRGTAKFKNDKNGWTLSGDELTYTKKYDDLISTSETFTFTDGTIRNPKIEIDASMFKFFLTYTRNSDNTMTVVANSNIGFKSTKTEWTLSSGSKKYQRTFDKSRNYSTDFTLITGEVINANINFVLDSFEVTQRYVYNVSGSVTVYETANIPFKNDKASWTLSSDKKTYTKEFTANQSYSLAFTSIYGQVVTKSINISKQNDVITITPVVSNYTGEKVYASATSKSGLEVTITYYSDALCKTISRSDDFMIKPGNYYAIAETPGNLVYQPTKTSCTKAVTINPIVLTLNQNAKALKVGSTYNLSSLVTTNVDTNLITWTSTNTNLATLKKSKVTAVAPGNVNITGTILDKKVTLSLATVINTPTVSYESDTLNYYVEKAGDYHLLTHIWVKNAYNQIKTALASPVSSSSLTPRNLEHPDTIIINEVNNKGYQNKGLVAVNASPMVKKYTRSGYSSDLFNSAAPDNWHGTPALPYILNNGEVIRDSTNEELLVAKFNYIYGIDKNGILSYYNYSTKIDGKYYTSSTLISRLESAGVKYTFGFRPVIINNGSIVITDNDDNNEKNIRQAICQIDKNNFILITNTNSTNNRSVGFSYMELANYGIAMGCGTLYGLDSGGSTSHVYKTNTATVTRSSTGYDSRGLADMLYFVEA